jgi:hypothetical protein
VEAQLPLKHRLITVAGLVAILVLLNFAGKYWLRELLGFSFGNVALAIISIFLVMLLLWQAAAHLRKPPSNQ